LDKGFLEAKDVENIKENILRAALPPEHSSQNHHHRAAIAIAECVEWDEGE
jgi:hypothetical protein